MIRLPPQKWSSWLSDPIGFMKNIILIGMMSSGKTTLGKKLARLLQYTFTDLDRLIEEDQHADIPKVFREKGEPHFREVESRMLKTLQPNRNLVIAAGGGTPCFHDNMDYIKTLGISIFLDVPAADLARRIDHHGKDDRPVLSGAASLRETLEKKIEERRPYYSKADITLGGDIDVGHLMEKLKPLL